MILVGVPSPDAEASPGLPVWELIWEAFTSILVSLLLSSASTAPTLQDHFDSETCVPDTAGVLRPSPEFWSASAFSGVSVLRQQCSSNLPGAEIGYKRGKDLWVVSEQPAKSCRL